MVIAKFVFKVFLQLLLTFSLEYDIAVPVHSEISILNLWPMRGKEKQFFVKDDVSFLQYARVNEMPIQTFAFPNYYAIALAVGKY